MSWTSLLAQGCLAALPALGEAFPRRRLARLLCGSLALPVILAATLPTLARAQLAPLGDLQSISGTARFGCAINTAGQVLCWGKNPTNVLGPGDRYAESLPQIIPGLPAPAVQVVTYYLEWDFWGGSPGGPSRIGSACALLQDGSVWCWGFTGDLVEGNTGSGLSFPPARVKGLSGGVKAIASVGYERVWVLLENGEVRDPLSSVNVGGPARAISVGGGVCALMADATVKCLTKDGSYATIAGLANVKAIATGGIGYGPHACALTEAGSVWCWGANGSGQLGDGSTTDRTSPVAVLGLNEEVTAITASGERSCALTAAGKIKCWGRGLTLRSDGNSEILTQATAIPDDGTRYLSIVANNQDTLCAVTVLHEARCWGWLPGTPANSQALPIKVAEFGRGAAAVSVGGRNTCVAGAAGGVQCWGHTFSCQDLGSWELDDACRPKTNGTPISVSNVDGRVRSLAMAWSSVPSAGSGCALLESGELRCWVWRWGDLYPAEMWDTNIVAVSATEDWTCTLDGVGAVRCDDNGGFDLYPLPGAAVDIDAGLDGDFYRLCAVMRDGSVVCRKQNSNRVVVPPGSDIQAVRGNYALTKGGAVRLLEGGVVPGLESGVTRLSVGPEHACALLAGGQVKCWGKGALGQTGDLRLPASSEVPTLVGGLPEPMVAISAGKSHTCALGESGAAYCWGDSRAGALGASVGRWLLAPAPVWVPAPSATVTEFHHAGLGHYFMTASSAEASGIDNGAAGAGWSRTGLNFTGFAALASNTRPLCRFYGTPGLGPNSHFYTLDSAECEWVKRDPGWTFEGHAFAAYPPGWGSACAGGSLPVYRLYNQRWAQNDSNHRYTTSPATYAQMQAAGWGGEGVVMCVPVP